LNIISTQKQIEQIEPIDLSTPVQIKVKRSYKKKNKNENENETKIL
jgi:hypothetical protein